MTSAMPLIYSRSGRVFKVSGSQSTAEGCQKAPARFLPPLKLTAVFPPTEESTIASSVVGICIKPMPLR